MRERYLLKTESYHFQNAQSENGWAFIISIEFGREQYEKMIEGGTWNVGKKLFGSTEGRATS